jgi:hypothetical protein
MAEEFKWRQRRLEHEEEKIRQEKEHARHEEELHEMRRKESRQQEQICMAFQAAKPGIMVYWGMKRPHDDKDPLLLHK